MGWVHGPTLLRADEHRRTPLAGGSVSSRVDGSILNIRKGLKPGGRAVRVLLALTTAGSFFIFVPMSSHHIT